MARYDLVVFDWDGTLMDSTGLIARCIQLAAADMDLPIPTEQQAKYIIGLGILDSTAKLFPGLSEAGRVQLAARYRYHYVARDHESPLYEGVREMLADLQRDETFFAVATGKPRAGLDRAFAHSGLKQYFHFSRCADEGFPKPHPDMLLKLMEFTATEPDRVVMIGDTTHDLQLAKNAGVDGVAVTYGAHPSAELVSLTPVASFDQVGALHAWLRRELGIAD
jgi:phosphoglycolate phosphatase